MSVNYPYLNVVVSFGKSQNSLPPRMVTISSERITRDRMWYVIHIPGGSVWTSDHNDVSEIERHGFSLLLEPLGS